jgi:hypothetical protein
VALRQESAAEALPLLTESLRLHHELKLELGAAESLAGLALLAALEGHAERSARLAGAVEGWLERLTLSLPPAEAQMLNRAVESVRSTISPTVFASAWAAGRTLAAQGPAAVVEHALDLYG